MEEQIHFNIGFDEDGLLSYVKFTFPEESVSVGADLLEGIRACFSEEFPLDDFDLVDFLEFVGDLGCGKLREIIDQIVEVT